MRAAVFALGLLALASAASARSLKQVGGGHSCVRPTGFGARGPGGTRRVLRRPHHPRWTPLRRPAQDTTAAIWESYSMEPNTFYVSLQVRRGLGCPPCTATAHAWPAPAARASNGGAAVILASTAGCSRAAGHPWSQRAGWPAPRCAQRPPAARPPARLPVPQMLPQTSKETPEACAEACLADSKCAFWSWCPGTATAGCVRGLHATCGGCGARPAGVGLLGRVARCMVPASGLLTERTPRIPFCPAPRRCAIAGSNGTTASTLPAKTCLLSYDASTDSLAVFAMVGGRGGQGRAVPGGVLQP